MVSDRDVVWRQCVRLGRSVLPLVDQEPWRATKRRERLGDWGIEVKRGESLIATFAGLAIHSVVADATAAGLPRTGETLGGIPLAAVIDATADKQSYEILAAMPTEHADEGERASLNCFRLLSYQDGRTGLWLPRLRTEVRHSLITLTGRARRSDPTCADLVQWAQRSGLE
ncbi:hypothetical protein [Streptomyces sp. NPDC006691]|uniref:hypothetical protein n=1 Tax=Streptomyces sp. NPDC006691 TaxID=3364757 RepID=UPI00369880E3